MAFCDESQEQLPVKKMTRQYMTDITHLSISPSQSLNMARGKKGQSHTRSPSTMLRVARVTEQEEGVFDFISEMVSLSVLLTFDFLKFS